MNDHHQELRERVAAALNAKPIGWNVDESGQLWPPHHAHTEHRYDGGCAICRFADRPEAFAAVLDAVLDALGLERVGFYMWTTETDADTGEVLSEWSRLGHEEDRFGDHDHCQPVYRLTGAAEGDTEAQG